MPTHTHTLHTYQLPPTVCALEVENYLVSTETAISCAKIAVEDHARERRANGLYKKQVLWATPNYNHPGRFYSAVL